MSERVTENTPCDICGDPLGMDSGHHVDFGHYEGGPPCHWHCVAGAYHGEVLRLRELTPAQAESQALKEASETIRILNEQLASLRQERKTLLGAMGNAVDVLLTWTDRPENPR